MSLRLHLAPPTPPRVWCAGERGRCVRDKSDRLTHVGMVEQLPIRRLDGATPAKGK